MTASAQPDLAKMTEQLHTAEKLLLELLQSTKAHPLLIR
jgi:hypothetical protein